MHILYFNEKGLSETKIQFSQYRYNGTPHNDDMVFLDKLAQRERREYCHSQ